MMLLKVYDDDDDIDNNNYNNSDNNTYCNDNFSGKYWAVIGPIVRTTRGSGLPRERKS
jgi:hypothetical protein